MRSRASSSAATPAAGRSAIPTANIELGDYQRPRYGIYAVRVTLDDGSERPGVASLGIRPTFEPPRELLEAHLFDFDGDLYGRTHRDRPPRLDPRGEEVRQHRRADRRACATTRPRREQLLA